MNYTNNASKLRREILVKIASLMKEGQLVEKVDMIPFEMIPKDAVSFRCCIHCDRHIIRERVLAALGFSLETDEREGKPLSAYAKEALERQRINAPFLTMLESACNSCVKSRYLVTNACQGCIARPCMMNCPKRAISMKDHHATIDNASCIGCGICVQACPYGAVVNVPIPCEKACPVGAIYKDEETGKEKIDYQKCIFCGQCITHCPFAAMMERSQVVDVLNRLSKKEEVIAIFAPAIVPQIPNTTPGKLMTALKQLGFSEVMEVAVGADITSQKEAHEFIERQEEGKGMMTTSCCPAYYEAVRKHIPELAPCVSETRSPMYYTAELVQQKYPKAKIVFVGPCLAKRREALESGIVDYVISAEELGSIFVANHIDLAKCEETILETIPTKAARGYAISGGVAAAVKEQLPEGVTCNATCINGLTQANMKLLKLYAQGKLKADLLEVMACEGGCIAGPSVIAKPKIAETQLKKFLAQDQ